MIILKFFCCARLVVCHMSVRIADNDAIYNILVIERGAVYNSRTAACSYFDAKINNIKRYTD